MNGQTVRHNLKILMLFLTVVLMLTWPAVLHLSDKLIGDGGDNYQYFGFQYITTQKLKNFQYPFSHSDIFRYPNGFEFERGYDSALSALLGGTLGLIIGNVWAYNLTIFILLTFNCFLSYVFFYYLTKQKSASFIGGIIYGLSSYVIARSAGHVNLMFVGGFPFFGYAFLKLVNENFSKKNLLVFFTSILLIFLGSFQYALMLIIVSLLLLLPSYFLYKNKIYLFFNKLIANLKTVVTIAMPYIMVVLIITLPFFTAYFKRELGFLDRTKDLKEYSPSLKDYIFPNQYLHLWLNNLTNYLNLSRKTIERVVFVGWLEIILFIGFLLTPIKKKRKLFLIIAITIFFILSLGTYNQELQIALPFNWLYSIFPFSYIPEASRFFIFFYLFLSIAIVLFLTYLWQIINNKLIIRMLVLVILGLVIIERLPDNFWLASTFVDKPYTRIVKENRGQGAMDIPAENYFHTTAYSMLPYVYGKKVLGGYFHYLGDTLQSRAFVEKREIKRFLCNSENVQDYLRSDKLSYLIFQQQQINKDLIKLLKENDIYTIVVHKNTPEDHAKYYFPECANVRMQVSILLPQLMMPDPTEKQKVLSIFFPAIPEYGDTITFENDGVFYLDGFHAYPLEWLPLHMFLDGEEIAIDQTWKDKGGGNATLEPLLKIDVKKGSRITFRFDRNHNTGYSFVKIWYRYQPDNVYIPLITENGIEKIYEDDDAAVFKIN